MGEQGRTRIEQMQTTNKYSCSPTERLQCAKCLAFAMWVGKRREEWEYLQGQRMISLIAEEPETINATCKVETAYLFKVSQLGDSGIASVCLDFFLSVRYKEFLIWHILYLRILKTQKTADCIHESPIQLNNLLCISLSWGKCITLEKHLTGI